MSNPIQNRYDFILVFDVQDGNPNGDPDAGNLPRLDPETSEGLVTDVCLKRKVRNYVMLAKVGQPSFDIFVKEKAILNNLIKETYDALGINLTKAPQDEKDGKKRNTENKGQGSEIESARKQMCQTYYDVRAFGAVMSTGANAGQVRGPVQMTFARSVEPVVCLEHSITRCAVATDTEAEKQSGDNRTMGRKNTISYGVYVAHGFISPFLAAQTGFGEEDLALLWDALKNMFEQDHSAARGLMSTCKLIVFKHESALGNAPSRTLFDRFKIKRNVRDTNLPARSFSDYTCTLNKESLPEGVEVMELM
ncbi:MAG: type I-C CRISPR-associated protein Cas7/Csd2 [Planctomycetia bacterium]|nr:type I-C CRISPR-associated protein Cas7/Csd2 [Planctomycetia bacterium]